jgi:mycothiol synthase
MSILISPFDPRAARRDELAGYHALWTAALAVDFAEDPPVAFEAAVDRLTNQPDGDVESSYWAAYQDRRMIGLCRVALGSTNPQIVRIEVRIHPQERCRGVGTALLREVLPDIVATGRSVVIGTAMKHDCPGVPWTGRLGFRVTHATVLQRLDIAVTPAGLWDVPVPDGFRLVRWTDATPDNLLAAYTEARRSIQDAPMGRSSNRMPDWTERRVREVEDELAACGAQERVVAALDETTGRVVGLTGVIAYPQRPGVGMQNDTVVVPAYRGLGLGRAMKAAMMRWITAERPDLREIRTITAEENVYMRTVNDALGYTVLRSMVWVETTTAELIAAMAKDPVAGLRV